MANQQKDGDSLVQGIVTACMKNRRGIMDGLRSFIKEDNHRAVDVGHLRKRHKAVEGPEAEFQ